MKAKARKSKIKRKMKRGRRSRKKKEEGGSKDEGGKTTKRGMKRRRERGIKDLREWWRERKGEVEGRRRGTEEK